MKHVTIYKETGRGICSLKADIYNADGSLYESTGKFRFAYDGEDMTDGFIESFKLWLDSWLKEPYSSEVLDI